MISVVIPTLDEAPRIGGLVRSLERPGVEIIVVDGGSRDATLALAREASAIVLESEWGRARQLRCGSEHVNGDLSLFFHADTRLPEGWHTALARAAVDPACVGGPFAFRPARRLGR